MSINKDAGTKVEELRDISKRKFGIQVDFRNMESS
jgi:hypothetical protein